MDRRTTEHVSILKLYGESIQMFNRYYKYESIHGSTRREDYLIPEVAYREAIANALVHRDWTVDGMVKVAMYADRIEVSSPGGLPHGVSEDDYLAGRLSVLRNPIIADVFARLGYIEKIGTGIPRIKAAYEDSGLRPRFAITSTSITVTLPVISNLNNLTDAEKKILRLLDRMGPLKRSEIEQHVDLGKSAVNRILNELNGKGFVNVEGVGRSTRYGL